MNTARSGELALDKIICDIEEVVENANLLAMDLAIKACENDALNGMLTSELGSIRTLADRAMSATAEIEKLARQLQAV